MRIGDVKVGEHYRLGYQYDYGSRRGVVTGIETKPVKKGWGYQERTVNQKRAVVQPVDEHTGESKDTIKPLSLTGREIEEPWADFAERHAEFLEKQQIENEIEATVERALERVDVDATVRINNRFRYNPIEVVVTFQGHEARKWFLKVLQAAEPYIGQLHEEDKGVLDS